METSADRVAAMTAALADKVVQDGSARQHEATRAKTALYEVGGIAAKFAQEMRGRLRVHVEPVGGGMYVAIHRWPRWLARPSLELNIRPQGDSAAIRVRESDGKTWQTLLTPVSGVLDVLEKGASQVLAGTLGADYRFPDWYVITGKCVAWGVALLFSAFCLSAGGWAGLIAWAALVLPVWWLSRLGWPALVALVFALLPHARP